MKTFTTFLCAVALATVAFTSAESAHGSPPAPSEFSAPDAASFKAPFASIFEALVASVLAVIADPAIRWTGTLCALALGFAACAWMTRRDRNQLFLERFGVPLRLLLRWQSLLDRLRGRALAFNVALTPNEVLDGVASLHGTAAIATKNYVVVRGADDQHFKIGSSVNDVPLGILLNDEIALDEVDVVKKGVALFGVYPGTLPGVAEAAIAVDAELTPGVGTFGRVKTLPVAAGSYMVIGRSRTTVAAAGDPVSIVHCVPYIRVVA